MVVDDRQARARFEAMFAEHWDAVVRYAARRSDRVDPEDVAGAVFANAWQHIDSIPFEAELPWLLRSASNQVITSWRRPAAQRRHLPHPRPLNCRTITISGSTSKQRWSGCPMTTAKSSRWPTGTSCPPEKPPPSWDASQARTASASTEHDTV